MSAVLDDERKEAFIQALDSLKEEQEEAERKAREKEDAIRKDIENARKLRAENEEKEKKRLEEERLKREQQQQQAASTASSSGGPTTEGDFGLSDSAPSKGTTGTTKKPSLKKKASALKNGGASTSSSSNAKPARPSRKGASSPTATKTNPSSSAVTGPGMGTRASLILNNIRSVLDHVMTAFHGNPFLLYRTLAFIIGFLLMFSNKRVRDRITRVVQQGWGKVRATAGMGMKVSYI